jgi:hypothetical protein
MVEDWIPMKAIEWLLYNHRFLDWFINSDEFIMRPRCNLIGEPEFRVGLPKDPVEDYELTKKKYLSILTAIDFTIEQLDQREKIFYILRFEKQLEVKQIRDTCQDKRNEQYYCRFCSPTVIKKRLEYIQKLAQVMVSAQAKQTDIIGMMRRFGPEIKKKHKQEVIQFLIGDG